MKKNIANIITGSRAILSLLLLFIPLSSVCFYTLYLLCGFTDMVDGTIARKTGTVSKFGAKLDTVADFVFMAACAVKLLPVINIPIWLWAWIAVIATIKATNIILGLIRRKKLVALHTVLNKTTGSLLFLLPFTLRFIVPAYSIAAVCAIATVAAIGEGYYIIKGNDK